MMVILPGCRCCGVCGWRSSDGSTPVTIEMDLEYEAAQTYTITSDTGEWTHTYTLADNSGTYSLDDLGEYRYDGVVVLRVNGIFSQVDDSFDIFVVIATNHEVEVFNNWTSLGSTSQGLMLFHSTPFVDHCEANQRTRYTAEPDALDTNTAQNHAGNIVFDYESNCSFPATISFRWWVKLNGFSGGTFPYTKTVGTDTFFGFDVTIRIAEIRYLFASETLVGFEDIGQTDCSPP